MFPGSFRQEQKRSGQQSLGFTYIVLLCCLEFYCTTVKGYEVQAAVIPKVALLFITRGQINTEPVWIEFFRAAQEVSLTAVPDYENTIGFQREDLEEYLNQDLLPAERVDRSAQRVFGMRLVFFFF
eukprot:TRINITY_DN8990_c1_g1_i1.p3 TRINITY_DN8990_c1_g1~~TRINITY_DN8990_c1_g1_i1.p3  ORF type:complete len:126 (-),score=14.21 TRINITY_DN8990_c1_g1_i1:164-541(-)